MISSTSFMTVTASDASRLFVKSLSSTGLMASSDNDWDPAFEISTSAVTSSGSTVVFSSADVVNSNYSLLVNSNTYSS